MAQAVRRYPLGKSAFARGVFDLSGNLPHVLMMPKQLVSVRAFAFVIGRKQIVPSELLVT